MKYVTIWKLCIALWIRCFLKISVWYDKKYIGKRSIQVESIDFNENISESLLEVVSDFVLQLFFKKPPLVKFWCVTKEEWVEKAIKILLHFPTIYLTEARFFFNILQPKQHIATYWILKQKWKSSCLLLSPDLKGVCKNNLKYHSTHYFLYSSFKNKK